MSGSEAGDEKAKMPEVLRTLGNKAIKRHLARQATPSLEITIRDGGWWFESPYHDEDEDHWVALLFDAFGTRSLATFRTFMCQLAELCSTDWNKAEDAWHPSEDELVAAVQIVRSTKPRNEAEACLAAQMVAVHAIQMKLSAQALKSGWSEPRTCAIAGKLARTYAAQLETMSRLKGRGSRQRITVRKYSQHEHKHIHLHQGDGENGNQPHEPTRGSTKIKAALEFERGSALPNPDASRDIVSVPRDERQKTLQTTRRSKGCGST
jgi:hypothetical protein